MDGQAELMIRPVAIKEGGLASVVLAAVIEVKLLTKGFPCALIFEHFLLGQNAEGHRAVFKELFIQGIAVDVARQCVLR